MRLTVTWCTYSVAKAFLNNLKIQVVVQLIPVQLGRDILQDSMPDLCRLVTVCLAGLLLPSVVAWLLVWSLGWCWLIFVQLSCEAGGN